MTRLLQPRFLHVAGLLAAPALLLLTGCQTAVLDPAGPVAAGERTILLNALAIMLAIVVPTIIATLGFAWWFRASNDKAEYRPDYTYSGRIELIVWSIPVLTILFLAGVIWTGSHQLDPARPIAPRARPLEVQAVSLDWKWLFIYPAQGVATVNQLIVPAGAPIHFSITSGSVFNSLFMPRLGSQIYAMNGMRTELHLQADKPGVYYGESAQFSGDGFSDMNFAVRAVPVAQFNAWVANARAAGPVLDMRGYVALTQPSQAVRPYSYRAVQPGLFGAIVTQRVPPAAGPQVGRGGPRVAPGDQN